MKKGGREEPGMWVERRGEKKQEEERMIDPPSHYPPTHKPNTNTNTNTNTHLPLPLVVPGKRRPPVPQRLPQFPLVPPPRLLVRRREVHRHRRQRVGDGGGPGEGRGRGRRPVAAGFLALGLLLVVVVVLCVDEGGGGVLLGERRRRACTHKSTWSTDTYLASPACPYPQNCATHPDAQHEQVFLLLLVRRLPTAAAAAAAPSAPQQKPLLLPVGFRCR